MGTGLMYSRLPESYKKVSRHLTRHTNLSDRNRSNKNKVCHVWSCPSDRLLSGSLCTDTL